MERLAHAGILAPKGALSQARILAAAFEYAESTMTNMPRSTTHSRRFAELRLPPNADTAAGSTPRAERCDCHDRTNVSHGVYDGKSGSDRGVAEPRLANCNHRDAVTLETMQATRLPGRSRAVPASHQS
jgi:hypothetical protein